jgi:hypothetical protein
MGLIAFLTGNTRTQVSVANPLPVQGVTGGGAEPILVQEVDAPLYEDSDLERAKVVEAYDSTPITTATTTAVKATDGVLGGVSVLATLTGTVTINDGGGTKVVLPIGLAVGYHKLPFIMTGEIEVVTSAADNIVVFFL